MRHGRRDSEELTCPYLKCGHLLLKKKKKEKQGRPFPRL
jgi:hypothetical protein